MTELWKQNLPGYEGEKKKFEELYEEMKNKYERLKNELLETKESLQDTKSSLKAKTSLISSLLEEIQELENSSVNSNPHPPVPSSSREVKFLKAVADYYSGQQCEIQGENELSELEQKWKQENERMLGGLKTAPSQPQKTKASSETQLAKASSQTLSNASCQNLNLEETNKTIHDTLSPPVQEIEIPGSLKTIQSGGYSYTISKQDLAKEQQAFQAGPGKRELVENYGVYISYIDLETNGNTAKHSPTGLMRSLISVWYSPPRLAASSATKGINEQIRTAVFKFCQMKFPEVTFDKLKRDLTNKCGEERRALVKQTGL